jgi:uncharacterized SAM-binding protein YcdF (DUF218 family)
VALLVTSVMLMYICSIGFTSNLLSHFMQSYGSLTAQDIAQGRPGAIVVLAGGIYLKAAEYGGDTVHLRTLGRIRYAARLARQTGLPLLASGGYEYNQDQQEAPDAELMRRILQEEFGITQVLVETTSRNTWENAVQSAKILQSLGIDTILLVTHAAHMQRAVESFQHAGLKVIPAPTLFFSSSFAIADLGSWLPSVTAIGEIYYELYEWLGMIWYRCRENGDPLTSPSPGKQGL